MYCSKCGTRVPEGGAFCVQCGAALPPDAGAYPPPPELRSAPPVTYGGFWRRGCAALVDFAVYVPFLYAFEYAVGHDPFASPDWSTTDWGIQWIELAVGWLYCATLESSAAQGTLGQQLLDLRVTDLGGRRIGFLRATARHFFQLFSLLTLGIGFLMIAFTARKQALHDRMSGCVFVRRGPAHHPVPPPRPVPPAEIPPPMTPSAPGLGA